MLRLRRYEWISIGRFRLNFHVEWDDPRTIFCTDREVNECLTTLLLTVFTQRNSVADFLREECNFRGENGHFAFFEPLCGLRATYAVHLRFIGKRVSIIVITEFFARCYG